MEEWKKERNTQQIYCVITVLEIIILLPLIATITSAVIKSGIFL